MSKPLKKTTEVKTRTVLKVKVIPNAPRTEVVEWMGDVLKIKIKAQPQEGAANEALMEYLADRLKMRKNQLHLLSGATVRLKLISIDGVVDLKGLVKDR